MSLKAATMERYRAEVTFQHKFEKVKGTVLVAGKALSSPIFYVRNLPFKLRMTTLKETKQICSALRCIEANPGFSCSVKCKFSLIRPSGVHIHERETGTHIFKTGHMCLYDEELLGFLNGTEHLVNDSVTIKVSVWADEPDGTYFEPPKKKIRRGLQAGASQKLGENLQSLLASGNFSDLSFNVKDDSSVVRAHKNILSARSPVFFAMLTTNMRESNNNEVIIDDMGSIALKILLHYIYSGQLEWPKELKTDATVCQELVNAGNKYDLPIIKEYAAVALTEFVTHENALELLKFMKLHNVQTATKGIRSFVKKNVDNITDAL